MHRRSKTVSSLAVILTLASLSMTVGMRASAAEPASAAKPGPAADAAVSESVWMNDPEVVESSGLAISRMRKSHFWTHNDSGGKARLYAFDRSGAKSGQIDFGDDVNVVDWEDMAGFRDEGICRLMIADTGDNQATRGSVTLYLMDEPDPRRATVADCPQRLIVRYPDGPRDCEAIAVDPVRRRILLITKTLLPVCGVYELQLPDRKRGTEAGVAPPVIEVTATRIGTVPLPMVTGMDLNQTTGDLWLIGYFQAFRFPCKSRTGSVSQQLAGLPVAVELPRWKQIEAVAVSDENEVWVTSEGSPAPLGRLKLP